MTRSFLYHLTVVTILLMALIAFGGCKRADNRDASGMPDSDMSSANPSPSQEAASENNMTASEPERITPAPAEGDEFVPAEGSSAAIFEEVTAAPEAMASPATVSAPDLVTMPGEDEDGLMSDGLVKYIKGNSVNMREAPALDSNILLRLNNGTEVKLLADEGTWCRVEYMELDGYIHKDYLSETPTIPLSGENVSAASNSLPDSLSSPAIVVKKAQRILELWDGDTLVASYPVGLGWEPVGDKKKEGDGRTPEGKYYVCTRNDKSKFYLSLGLSYPNADDAKEALDNGLIDRGTYEEIVRAIENKSCPPWNTPMGGEIMIHGNGSHMDWTAGCIAVDNNVMDILWRCCPLRTPVTIEP